MTIDVHKPELVALIRQRMENGDFVDVEDLLIEALRTAPLAKPAAWAGPLKTGADLVKAMQTMPHNDTDIEPFRPHQSIRDTVL